MDQTTQDQIKLIVKTANEHKYTHARTCSPETFMERKKLAFVRRYHLKINGESYEVTQCLTVARDFNCFSSMVLRGGVRSNLQPLKNALARAQRACSTTGA